MAKKKATGIKTLPSGKVQVFYDDGTSSIMTVESARMLGLAGTPEIGGSPTGSTVTAGSYGTGQLDTAFTDTTTGGMVAGTGLVPTKNGPKTIAELVMQAKNPKNLANIKNQLIKYGLITKGTKSLSTIQNSWLQVLINSSISQIDPEDYMKQLKAGGIGADTAAAAANVPTKQIYKYTPQQVTDMVDESAQNLVGRVLNEEDKKQTWYQDLTKSINKMIEAGTVTKTVKKGGMNVVTTTPGITKEDIAAKAKTAITTNLAEDVNRKRQSDFATWLYDKIGSR